MTEELEQTSFGFFDETKDNKPVVDIHIDYTIEPHGEKGNYALYLGRTSFQHGFRLCNLNDFDDEEEGTIQIIVDALNKVPELETEVASLRAQLSAERLKNNS